MSFEKEQDKLGLLHKELVLLNAELAMLLSSGAIVQACELRYKIKQVQERISTQVSAMRTLERAAIWEQEDTGYP
jgi:hypothetical protein